MKDPVETVGTSERPCSLEPVGTCDGREEDAHNYSEARKDINSHLKKNSQIYHLTFFIPFYICIKVQK